MKRSAIQSKTPMSRGTAALRVADGKARASAPVPITKRCAKTKGGCGEFFVAMRGRIQAACSPRCAQDMATLKRQKAERKSDQEQRAKLKTRSQWMAEAQSAFNAWVRARDAGKPCICCGRFSTGQTRGGEFDAGHYRSRGAAPHLRFDQRNCHAQLKHCNRYAFDVAAYRAGLIERIGLAEVERLEVDETPRKYTAETLKLIRDTYKRLARELKNGVER